MGNTVNRVTIQTALKPKFERAYREVFEELGLDYNSDNIRRAVRAGAHEIAKACLENGANQREFKYVMEASFAKESTSESLGDACVLATGPKRPLPAVNPPEGEVEVEILSWLDNTLESRTWEGSERQLSCGNATVSSSVPLFPFVVEAGGKRIIPPGNALYEALNAAISRVGGHAFEVTRVQNETEFDVRYRAGY
jgi:hypothetical protein